MCPHHAQEWTISVGPHCTSQFWKLVLILEAHTSHEPPAPPQGSLPRTLALEEE